MKENQTTRTVIPRGEMECLYAGELNSFYRVQTALGPREMAAHNADKSNLLAAKMLVLCLNDGATLKQRGTHNTLPDLLETLRETGLENFSTLIMAADRPVSYFEFPIDITANHQLEIPGGISLVGEKTLETALRELMGEYGLKDPNDIIQTAPLVTYPAANDAGTNAELYTTRVTLVRQQPSPPPNKKGIRLDKCWFGPLLEVEDYLKGQGAKGVIVEWLALGAIFQLGLELHGGWKALRK